MTFSSVEMLQCELNAVSCNPWFLYMTLIFTLQFEGRKGDSPGRHGGYGKLIQVYLKVTTGKLPTLPWNKGSESTHTTPVYDANILLFLGNIVSAITNSSY